MSVVIRPAREPDIGPVCRFLHEKMNRRIAPERWARLATYPWLAAKPDLGRVAMDGSTVAGFVGMVHADRAIAGRTERVVNICAWYLDRAYRGSGLGTALMAAATEDPAMSYAILTSSGRTPPILARLGYHVLETERLVWQAGARPRPAPLLEHDPGRIAAALGPAARRLLADHAGLPVRPLLLAAEGESALLMLSVVRKDEEILWYDVMHAGAPAVFARHAQAVADAILPEPGARLAIDRRLLRGAAAPEASIETLSVPRFLKSARLEPADIDNLYSELQLLDLKLE